MKVFLVSIRPFTGPDSEPMVFGTAVNAVKYIEDLRNSNGMGPFDADEAVHDLGDFGSAQIEVCGDRLHGSVFAVAREAEVDKYYIDKTKENDNGN